MTSSDKTPLRGRLFYLIHITIPLLILAITSLLFNLFHWDMAIQRYYYRSGWFMNDKGWVQVLYRYGNIPALIVTVTALYIFLRSFNSGSRHSSFRRLSLYLVLVMIIGPGLIVNSILKDNWGRPRPRELAEFGGRHAYEAPLRVDPSSGGKSFPCGHATMGFYFFAPAYVLMLKKRAIALMVHGFAIIYGSLIGWVRIMQGGHFFSDVIFAGVIVYLCSVLLWRWLKLHDKPFDLQVSKRKALKIWQKALIILVGLIIALAVSLASPYTTSQKPDLARSPRSSLSIDLQNANVNLAFSDSSFVHYSASGFGFPGSKARIIYQDHGEVIYLKQIVKGFFSELNAELDIVVDTLLVKQLDMRIAKGELFITDDPHTKAILKIINSPSELTKAKEAYQIQVDKVNWLEAP